MITNDENKLQKGIIAKRETLSFYFSMIIAACSVLTFLTLLIVALVIVPKAVNLMNTAQTTLDNMQKVSDQLTSLKLAETIQNIDDNTARAMQDVSDSMEQIQALDIESLNQSIQDLKESTESFKLLFSR